MDVLIAGLLVVPLHASAPEAGQEIAKPAAGQPAAGKKTPTTPKARSKHVAARKPTVRKVRTSPYGRSGKGRYQSRVARLRLEPERVTEIQGALAQAGYLNQEPTGKWDDPTREAMRRYQADHGFPTTGLPEAKSLMKLGLGPHALPDDVDPSGAARASVDASAKTAASSSADPPSAQDPPKTEAPHKEQ